MEGAPNRRSIIGVLRGAHRNVMESITRNRPAPNEALYIFDQLLDHLSRNMYDVSVPTDGDEEFHGTAILHHCAHVADPHAELTPNNRNQEPLYGNGGWVLKDRSGDVTSW